ncbi:ribonuclease E/G [Sellimonas sp.]|uniref:ribonuclease E/G n=1 Tax=Sellimonas sp. TaxID=2021466 RepID=UPI00257ABE4B|nr:ribonuclease E/G [Sellimonas sp.]
MKQKVLVTNVMDRLCFFLEEDGKTAEIFCTDETAQNEHPEKTVHAGDIYIGKVKKRIPNIHAVFIEIFPGMECYCSEEEAADGCFTSKAGKKPVCVGDELVVQVKKEASKAKKPSLTTDISLTGRYAVVSRKKQMPGVSSRIPKKEREALKAWLQETDSSPFGVILRTEAAQLTLEELHQELRKREKELADLLEKARTRTCFTRLKAGAAGEEAGFAHVRWDTLEEVVTDLPDVYERLRSYLEQTEPKVLDSLRLYTDPQFPLVKLYSLEREMERALSQRVWLKSGGSLIIQPTEALTVIDVNTGRAVSGKNERYLKQNLEAAKEAARQIRLRNLSGIILIDFINLSETEDREILIRTMRELTAADPVKTEVIDITRLELMEITRKKVHPPLYEAVRKKAHTDE